MAGAPLVLGNASVTTLETPTPSPVASIDLSQTSGTPGTSLVIKGTGFPSGEVVALYIDRANPYWYITRPPGPTADERGEFTVSLKWPGTNYDRFKQIDPTKPGVHRVCGDTGYPGSTQPIAVKACAQFTVPGASPAPAAPDQLPNLPLPVIVAAIAIVLVLAVAGQWWMQRQSKGKK